MMRFGRIVAWTGLGLGALTALVGVAHTDFGRPLLGFMAAVAGCPAHLDGADPADVEAFRVRQQKARAGSDQVRRPVAWHFELGKSQRSDVESWAARTGVVCESARQDSLLRCQVPPADPDCGEPSAAHLQFDAQGRLVALDLMHPKSHVGWALEHLARVRGDLEREAGPETRLRGALTRDHLAAERFRRTAIEYRYSRYLAKLSATNLGAGSILVREQYQWLPPTES